MLPVYSLPTRPHRAIGSAVDYRIFKCFHLLPLIEECNLLGSQIINIYIKVKLEL